MRSILTTAIILSLFMACSSPKTAFINRPDNNADYQLSEPEGELVHSVYLIGDQGELDYANNNYVLDAVKEMLDNEPESSSLVYLGDNIYPAGLPSSEHPDREEAERIINAQLDILEKYKGKAYMIPGNHDWNKYSTGGRKAVKRQEKYVQSYYEDKKIKFYPNHACGDPEKVKIHKDLVMVFIDSQWWLQNWSDEKNINKGCDIKSRTDYLQTLEEIFVDHRNDEILLLMHHPILSNGNHGGYFNLKQHLFPLHELNNLWIPLPVLGSLYPVFRQLGLSRQDITNELNRELTKGIQELAGKHKINLIVASGHEHSLQYFDRDKIKYIVSGSAGKTDYVRKSNDIQYVQEARGFAKLNFYSANEAWLEFYSVAGIGQPAKSEFKVRVRQAKAGSVESELKFPELDPTEKEITLACNPSLKAGPIKSFLMGDQYRKMWTTPVTTRLIDLENELGGLIPVKKGGGMASNSLRMVANDEKEYILRSINKDYTRILPPEFRDLSLVSIAKDQNSANMPYGALIIPVLSEAANVYYTDPDLVYLKHQKALGNYNLFFPEEMYLLEQRPDGDWSDSPYFGSSSNIIGYSDLLEILREKKNHFVDQEWTLKSRLFDIFIHDWDRHDDQWRWASFEKGDKTIYQPVPRDRDMAFYRFRGLFPSYMAAFMVRKFKSMKHNLVDVAGHTTNGKDFDRYFLNELEWEEWIPVIDSLQSRLTDQVIDNAIDALPDEVEDQYREELVGKLKSRRDRLKDIARKFYLFINREVQIVGTDNEDEFKITINPDQSVTVEVEVDRKKKSDLKKYKRTILNSETKEIRLFGLRDKDEFVIEGNNKTDIKIRIIGGEGKDEVKNLNPHQNILVYDIKKGIEWEGDNIKDKTSDNVEVNEYDREWFKYNSFIPLLSYGITQDDGFLVGAQFSWTTQAWRKDPFSSRHSASLKLAPLNRSVFLFKWQSHFRHAIGKVDFTPSVSFDFPRYENYFGIGNETVNEASFREYNWVRLRSYEIAPRFQLSNSSQTVSLAFGPHFESHRIVPVEGRVYDDENIGFSDEDYDRRYFGGASMAFESGFTDNANKPSYGFIINSQYIWRHDFSASNQNSEWINRLRIFLPVLAHPQLVLSNQVGYSKSFGELQFYQYQDLGHTSFLRGYRNERFRGHSAFFHNIDLRLSLFNWTNRIVPMKVGMIGAYDYGRVWADSESSDTIHDSQSVGLWFDMFGVSVIQTLYSFTDEGNQFSLNLGFSF